MDASGTVPVRRLQHIRKEVRAFGPDVVVSHSALPNLYARLAVKKSVAPVVCVLHSAARDFDDAKLRVAETLLKHRAAAIIAVSASQVAEYRSRFPDQQIDMIPNGVGSHFFPATIPPAEFRITSVGRVAGQKDPDTWASIARRVTAANGNVRFDWVGPTDVDPEYANLVSVFDASEDVIRFVGPSDDVPAALRRSRMLLHTARREAHSVALLEAAAAGLPIVCTSEVGLGLPDWIVREEFDAGNVDGGVAAVRRVLEDIDAFQSRAISQAARVLEQYGARVCAERYLDVFNRVVGTSS
ncbi:glycosyltransferase family 4 protein [uncultured Microbacterium sp.]|uniref:glycosyltransferase family 4 protein n=1 Tax=uncultured Microbacterium sp. TaxID=191216 RepID=UPI0025EABAD8|nr:glycosyltransferase family 4 protein [uncultured Microbacterium sp.]